MENKMSDANYQLRRAERRVCTQVAPPPYETRDGRVMNDRRSAIDRRASWIREYSLETSPGKDA